MIHEFSAQLGDALEQDVDDGLTIAAGLSESQRGPLILEALAAADSEVTPLRRLKALRFAQAILATAKEGWRPRELAFDALLALSPLVASPSIHERRTVAHIAALVSRFFEGSGDAGARDRSIFESIEKGDVPDDPGLPESFNVLVRELQALSRDEQLAKK